MPSYLTLHGTTYHFRFFVPEALQPVIGQKVVKMSLRTGRKRLAKRKAGQLASAARKIILKAKESEFMDMQQLQRSLRTYLKYLLDMDDVLRAVPVEIENDESHAELFFDTIQQGLRKSDNASIKHFVDEFLSMTGHASLSENSLEYNLLARQMHKILVQFAHVGKLRAEGDVIAEQDYLDKLFPDAVSDGQTHAAAPTSTGRQQASESKDVLIEGLIEAFTGATDTTPETRDKYNTTIREFLAITSIRNIAEINHPVLRDYIEVLKSLPPNYAKLYAETPVLEVAQMSHEKTVTARTVNDKIGIMGRFFKWAINQGYMEINYADGKRLPKGKPQHSTHEPYTIDDLRKMFNALQYVKDSFRSPYQFWMVPLALYTGARQSELAQLRCKDVYQPEEGIWAIRVMPDDDDESSSVKTVNAIRTIPLHPVLTEQLNFHAFVRRVRRAGNDRVFPEIKPRQGKYGKVVSQWFNDRFKKNLDLQPPRSGFKKDFHSFRNTFIDAAKQARVEISMIEETVGHASALGMRQQSMSGDYYANEYSERIRYEELMLKVNFDIDLSHLKKSKYTK
ncbi:DUF6538 domain-containing protein [Salidesulfovibrio onnuriiensis]|uniref:DUF6538 domain-containing protein n=1 Tax=Salidesulfovibrio onnuriiensis TaxID=2583823 RepID=UPI00164F4C80|nr:DUF6538 domain-containing protein [Salidesulfovibrio onnuriiensis]